MQTEPPKADSPKRKRRWFQFSLRTLMIVVTLVAVLCGTVTWIIRDRQRLIRERDEAIEKSHNRAEAMAWMYRANQAEAELSRRPPRSVIAGRSP
jgi:hypothetical protein